MKPTNHDRARYARYALDVFTNVTYRQGYGELLPADREDAIADLIADLLHLAENGGMDALAIARRGMWNYEDESKEANAPERCTMIAPASWCGYLLNGDKTSLDAVQRAACDSYFEGWRVLDIARHADGRYQSPRRMAPPEISDIFLLEYEVERES